MSISFDCCCMFALKYSLLSLKHLGILSPLQLYFNPSLVFGELQLWRLITCFCFFGHIDFNFFFNMYFVYRYCRMLEENYYYGRSADFLMMFIFGGCLSLIAGIFLQMLFLSHVLTMMLVYVWSRRSPSVRLNIMGLFTVNAPYLPWVFFAISYLLGNNASVDFVGIVIGHLYYVLEDVFPNQPQGFKILRTPTVLKNLLDGRRDDPAYRPLPEERPGGFDWGAN
uniref:Derlin n=1 Tax=Schistocephalus solidus TaxID=70667 RepID=A0A0X3NKN3_SCHSO